MTRWKTYASSYSSLPFFLRCALVVFLSHLASLSSSFSLTRRPRRLTKSTTSRPAFSSKPHLQVSAACECITEVPFLCSFCHFPIFFCLRPFPFPSPPCLSQFSFAFLLCPSLLETIDRDVSILTLKFSCFSHTTSPLQ